MIKIGILTFQNACNFGAVLQAYALKTYLEQCDVTIVEIINYKNQQIEKEKLLWKNLFENNILKQIIRNTLLLPYIYRRNRLFNSFNTEYLGLSKEINKEQMNNLDYDLYIVGSDQVWNRQLTENDRTFFCDFCENNVPCYSYAASIGSSKFTDIELGQLKNLLERFSSISFRERELVPIFKSVLPNKKIVSCLDPVYLLDNQLWGELCINPKRKPYLLIFCVGSNPELTPTIEFAKKLANSKGLDVIYMSDQDIWYKHREVEHCGAVAPGEFLGYIRSAEYVVTNSFHATSFSIIFHTSFYSETGLSRNGRVINILDLMGLNDRALKKGKAKKDYLKEIDWNMVEKKISDEKAFSKEYLINIVRNNI